MITQSRRIIPHPSTYNEESRYPSTYKAESSSVYKNSISRSIKYLKPPRLKLNINILAMHIKGLDELRRAETPYYESSKYRSLISMK